MSTRLQLGHAFRKSLVRMDLLDDEGGPFRTHWLLTLLKFHQIICTIFCKWDAAAPEELCCLSLSH